MITKETVNRIVNKYLEWTNWCEENNVSVDDDDQYAIWLKKTTKELNLIWLEKVTEEINLPTE